MLLSSIANSTQRGGREFLVVSHESLRAWAAAQGLTLRQAIDASLEAGIIPELFDRNVPGLRAADQLRLWRSRALVVGLGGLGGLHAQLLARIGVGHLILFDPDAFVVSNLNRQLLATSKTVGQSKAAVTGQYLREINEALIVEAFPGLLEGERLREVLPTVQVVLDGLDSFGGRRNLISAAQQAGVPVVHGAVHGHFCQVTTVLPQDPDDYLALFPLTERIPWVMPAAVTLTASLQVLEAIRLLLGQAPNFHGTVAHFDGDTGRLEFMRLG